MKDMIKRDIPITISISIILLSILLTGPIFMQDSIQSPFCERFSQLNLSSTLIVKNPMVISDDGLAWEEISNEGWCTGSGTPSDPYIILGISINAGKSGSCLTIQNSEAYFMIQDSKFSASGSQAEDAGIKLINVKNGILRNNVISSNENDGIFLKQCSFNSIHHNQLDNNKVHGIQAQFSSPNNFSFNSFENNNVFGMFLQDSHNNTVQSNEITDCESSGTGIYLRRSHSNDIIENTADSNSYNGLWAIESNENVINGNLFRENGKYGMVLYESNHNYLTENTASNNVQNDGITLSYSNYNVLSKNNASSNGANGIRLMNEASNNTVFKNTLRSNLESGVKIESKCSFNLLFFNNFIANALNGRDDGMNNSWDDDTLGNYWDDHDGLDVDEDGIGDNPYYIAGAAEAVDHFPLVNNVYSGVITIEETAEDSEDDSANDPEGSGGVIGDITTWLFTPVGMITLAGGITLMGAGMGIILMKKKGIGPFSETKKDFSSERTTESEGLLNEPTNNSTDQS